MTEAAEDPTPLVVPPRFRLSRLQIENFKGIDELELELPPPLMSEDPDVLVLGSRNGVGKTSVLEACTLFWFTRLDPSLLELGVQSEAFSFRDHFIRAGSTKSRIIGTEAYHSGEPGTWFRDHTTRTITISASDPPTIDPRPTPPPRPKLTELPARRAEEVFLRRLFGAAREPFCWGYLMYFHSSRGAEFGVVQPGRNERVPSLDSLPWSGGWFKDELLHHLMAQAGLFEDIRSNATETTAKVLAELFGDFADSRLAKLRAQSNNAYDIRVRPRRGGESFSFDGLSSGQKEMITTLFLIWQNTREAPALVLIDEPELHLNAEWQVKFVRLLFKLAPYNQYILATHSEHVFGSVQEDRRILIGPQG